MRTAVTAVVVTLMAISVASANVRAYAIDPVRADWSGRADPNPLTGGVSEVITVCFDSLTDPAYIECFVGDGSPTGYHVDVFTYPDPSPTLVAEGDGGATRGHSWVRFDTLTVGKNPGTLPGLSVRGASRAARYARLPVETKLVLVRQGETGSQSAG